MEGQRSFAPAILCLDYPRNAAGLQIRRQVLEAAGYRVHTALCVAAALEIISNGEVDLVLTEQLDAASLAAMKRLNPEVRIVIYSADWKESQQAMRFAAIFVTKLAPVDELLCTIAGLLEKPASGGSDVDVCPQANPEGTNARDLIEESRKLIQTSSKRTTGTRKRLRDIRAADPPVPGPPTHGDNLSDRSTAEKPHKAAA